ncbi:DUF1345 domain-containing protein [Uliginosibacterium sp. H3]|uniref:DUF1345 domain-containing protein n=1 Tax=Uliginosibacterium silvisoli TaxID=3114758 RepID=A0ABU6K093_9RHOO|nr:DUF1345 domain-containing protein [Uliginosibacterium sp. H3]
MTKESPAQVASPAQPKRCPGFLTQQAHLHPRLIASVLVGVVIAWLIPRSVVNETITRVLLGWNVSAWLYLVLAAIMMLRSTHESMRARAECEDEGKVLLLILVIITAIASLVAIVVALLAAKDLSGGDKAAHLTLVACTIVASWAFTHTMFALHYAHDFYVALANERDGGLVFPGTKHPDYSDFLYFAAVIGTSGQTADVSFSSQRMRRIGALHCVLAFFFNTSVLALTINIAASML